MTSPVPTRERSRRRQRVTLGSDPASGGHRRLAVGSWPAAVSVDELRAELLSRPSQALALALARSRRARTPRRRTPGSPATADAASPAAPNHSDSAPHTPPPTGPTAAGPPGTPAACYAEPTISKAGTSPSPTDDITCHSHRSPDSALTEPGPGPGRGPGPVN